MAQARDIRKVQLLILVTILALGAGAFAIVRLTQRKRARKVDEILDACIADPNCVVDKKGDVVGDDGNGGGIITDAVAISKARALVDDIWGFTATIKKSLWTNLMTYDDNNFRKIVLKANAYIKTKADPWVGSKPRNFHELLDWETSPRLNSGAINSRIRKLGLN